MAHDLEAAADDVCPQLVAASLIAAFDAFDRPALGAVPPEDVATRIDPVFAFLREASPALRTRVQRQATAPFELLTQPSCALEDETPSSSRGCPAVCGSGNESIPRTSGERMQKVHILQALSPSQAISLGTIPRESRVVIELLLLRAGGRTQPVFGGVRRARRGGGIRWSAGICRRAGGTPPAPR
jgi:hypothetical protein